MPPGLPSWLATAVRHTGASTSASPSGPRQPWSNGKKEHPKPVATLEQVADHIEHLRQVAGVDHIGLGSDFDGIPEGPRGLEGVDRYPALLAELMRRGWSDADVAKVAGENVLRVMAEAERIAQQLRANKLASEATLPKPAQSR